MSFIREPEHIAQISSEDGNELTVPFFVEGGRQSTVLIIDGVSYHLERIPRGRLTSDYLVDDDPNYQPQADAEGYCCILAPFSE